MWKKIIIFTVLALTGFFLGYLCGVGTIEKIASDYTTLQRQYREVKKEVEIEENTAKIVIVGDIMLGRSVNAISFGNNDWDSVFMGAKNIIKGADIAIGNLESPLIKNCPITNEGMVFCGSERWGEVLSEAGFDVMTLANNHSLNYGKEGLINTQETLKKAGIESVGIDKGIIKEINGIRVGILGYNDVGKYEGIKAAENKRILEEIGEMRKIADVVVVYFHWGAEYVGEPTERQEELAMVSVGAGANIVVGTHPHWTQKSEKVGNSLVVYSLGNFVFDQMWSQETRRGKVVDVVVDKNGVIDYEEEDIVIENYRFPKIDEPI